MAIFSALISTSYSLLCTWEYCISLISFGLHVQRTAIWNGQTSRYFRHVLTTLPAKPPDQRFWNGCSPSPLEPFAGIPRFGALLCFACSNDRSEQCANALMIPPILAMQHFAPSERELCVNSRFGPLRLTDQARRRHIRFTSANPQLAAATGRCKTSIARVFPPQAIGQTAWRAFDETFAEVDGPRERYVVEASGGVARGSIQPRGKTSTG